MAPPLEAYQHPRLEEEEAWTRRNGHGDDLDMPRDHRAKQSRFHNPPQESYKEYGETDGHEPRPWVSQRVPSAIFDLGFEDTYYIQVHLLKPKPIQDEERFKPLRQRPTHLGTTPHQPELGIYSQMLVISHMGHFTCPYARMLVEWRA